MKYVVTNDFIGRVDVNPNEPEIGGWSLNKIMFKNADLKHDCADYDKIAISGF